MKQKHNTDRRSLKKDDAVSNVVVMMLILSVVVIVFSVFVGIYLPQMKETSEMMHSEDVKSAFLKFSSDMDSVYSRGQAGTYSEVFSLGGGDILLSSSKSAGTVEIETIPLIPLSDPPSEILKIYYTKKRQINSNNEPENYEENTSNEPEIISLNTVKVSYHPVLPYWEEQGYWYEKGVVWVQKGNVSTPVSSALRSAGEGDDQMNQTAVSWLKKMNPVYLTENKTITVTKDSEENVPVITEQTQRVYTMTLVDVAADENHTFLSGSGDAKLKISADVSEITEYELSDVLQFELSDTLPGINGPTVSLNAGSLLRVTKIAAKVSVE